jgi:hypothetical protein
MPGVMVPAQVSPESPPRASHRTGSILFVWSVWGLAVAAALWLVGNYGRNLPQWDDWEMVPALTGTQSVTPSWLWSQHNEHRIPLPRLLLLALYTLSGNDVRAGMFFNVAALGVLAAILILVAGRLRSSSAYADAFFPLFLLHWGHAENLLWSWQVGFLSSTVLAGVLLGLLALWGNRLTPARLLGVGGCLLLLPLCGANGLVLVPPLLLWLCGVVRAHWRSGQLRGRGESLLALALVLALVAVLGVYFLGYERPADHPHSAGVAASLRTSLECWGMLFGLWGRPYWFAAGLAAVGLWLTAALLLSLAAWQRPNERLRALGLLLFLVSFLGLALVVGWGRSGFGLGGGLRARYVSLMTPTLCGLYFVVGLYTSPRVAGVTQRCLALLAGLMFVLNVPGGLTLAEGQRQVLDSFQKDLETGLPPFVLVDRYSRFPLELYPDPVRFAAYLSQLRQARVKPFDRLAADPVLREVKLVEGQNVRQRPDGVFVLGEARFVCAFRLRYQFDSSARGFMGLRAFWGDGGSGGAVLLVPEPEEKAVVIWVNERVNQFGFQPSDPSAAFQIREIVLLIPQAGERP